MANENPRKNQVSLRLNDPETEVLDRLVGYRGLWERCDVLRYGLQLVLEESKTSLFASQPPPAAAKRQGKRKESDS